MHASFIIIKNTDINRKLDY